MRILYLYSNNLNCSDGVLAKIAMQIRQWRDCGHQVQSFLINTGSRKAEAQDGQTVIDRNSLLRKFSRLYRKIVSTNPDIIYCRFEPFKPYFSKVLQRYKVIMEINTDDLKECCLLKKSNLRHWLRYVYNKYTRHLLLDRVSGLVSATVDIVNRPEFVKFHKPIKFIPNSIILDEYPILKKIPAGKLINLVFLFSRSYPWNGLDKLYPLALKTLGLCQFHLIGKIDSEMKFPKNVITHGYLQKKEYHKIIAGCQLGLGPLALHRKEMDNSSPIKVREYLAYGLPIIIAYDDSAFGNSLPYPPWVLKLPNNETNVLENIKVILDFCMAHKNTVLTHEQVSPFIAASRWEKERINFFGQVLEHES